jgi:hypothetical protein
MTWKTKKHVKRQEDTFKELQRLKEEKEMQLSESHDSKSFTILRYIWEENSISRYISKIRVEYVQQRCS